MEILFFYIDRHCDFIITKYLLPKRMIAFTFCIMGVIEVFAFNNSPPLLEGISNIVMHRF